MSRDRQIREMAFDIIKATSPLGVKDLTKQFDYKTVATELYEVWGWRRASEVARELIAEIDNALHDMAMEYYDAGHPEYFAVCEMVHHKVIAPIEKKYTEGGE
jgi:hypothetical protein